MALIPLPLPTISDKGRFGEDGANRLINVVLEKATLYGGRPGLVSYPRYGLTAFATLAGASGGVRAVFDLDNTAYCVSGRQVYQVDTSGSATQLTGGISADGPVRHARNMASIPMVAMTAGGTLTLLQGGTLTEVNDEDLPPPVDVAFLGGYLVFPSSDGRFFWSAINGIDVDALDFASAEYQSDRILRTISHRNEIWHIGQGSVEVWGITGDADAPFGRVAVRDFGCRAAGSVCEVSDTLIWINKRGEVVRSSGYDAVRISHHAIERDIRAADPGDITATTFALEGHSFYVLNMPTRTWVYDAPYGWTEWTSRQSARWNISACAAFDNRVIAGSSEDGTLYEIDPDATDDAGDDLIWSVRTMAPASYPRAQVLSAVFVNVVAGRAPVDGDAEDVSPEMILKVSRDGGNTWPVSQRRSIGLTGQRNKDVIFRSLGLSGRIGTTLELSMSAAVGSGIVSAVAEMGAAAP